MDLDGATGLLPAGDLESSTPTEPWVALLPTLGSTLMGWADRHWYLGERRAALFDYRGSGGPTAWSPSGCSKTSGADAVAAIAVAADRLGRWLGGTRVTPHFRTALERELRR